MNPNQLIQQLLDAFAEVRYVAIYENGQLTSQQRMAVANSSAADSDTYEELLVNPTLLTLAGQRGNIDCGGLNYLIIRYGHFYQLVKPTATGHISVCLEPDADLNTLPGTIFDHINALVPEQEWTT